MSAILGQIAFDGRPTPPEALRPAMEAIALYGGDGSGMWSGEGVVLGSQVRHLTPESRHEAQPYARHGRVIVADARLDNRDELCVRLGVGPADRAALPDSALLLRAYERWGDACPDTLVGDFAFAVWDGPARTLFCARDPVGARPLYVYHAPPLFAFCSDLRGLLAVPGVPEDVDEDEVARYLRNPLHVAVRRTFFRGIEKLPFARSMSVTARGIQEATYWEPFARPPLQRASEEAYAEELRALVTEAVEARARTPFGVAAHLSGGLDSSAVTVLARRALGRQGRQLTAGITWSPAYSDAYPPMERDERSRIELVCRTEGVTPLYPEVAASDFHAFLNRDVGVLTTVDLVTEWAALPRASALGVRTVLSGWGGDEGATFNGRGLLAELLRRGRWPALARLLRRHVGRRPGPLARAALFNLALPHVPDAFYAHLARLAEQRFPPALIHPGFARRAPFHGAVSGLAREQAGVRRTQRGLLAHGHLAARMEAWTAWGAPHGVVYSYPLTDRRVLEFAYALPPELYWQRGYTRYLFRKAMEGVLPPEVQWEKSKHDAAVEHRRRDLRLGAWRALAREVDAGLWDGEIHPWIDVPRLREEMRSPPDTLTRTDIFRFLRIRTALEMRALSQHHPPRA